MPAFPEVVAVLRSLGEPRRRRGVAGPAAPGRSARELGLDVVAGRRVLLGARHGLDDLPVPELRIATLALRLAGRQALEDVDRQERLVVALADRHVALAERDVEALDRRAEVLGSGVTVLHLLGDQVDRVVGVDAVA